MELVNHRWINSTKDKYEQMHSRRFPNNIVTRPKDLSQTPHIFQKRFSNVLARFFYINNVTIISLHFLSCPTNKFLTITLTSFTLLQAWRRVCSYGLYGAVTMERTVSIRGHADNGIMVTMTEKTDGHTYMILQSYFIKQPEVLLFRLQSACYG